MYNPCCRSCKQKAGAVWRVRQGGPVHATHTSVVPAIEIVHAYQHAYAPPGSRSVILLVLLVPMST